MNANHNPRRRIRGILDGILVVLLILSAGWSFRQVEAQSGRPEPPAPAAAPLPADQPAEGPESEQSLIDTKILAGMIAAENAALTPPLFFVDVPFVVR